MRMKTLISVNRRKVPTTHTQEGTANSEIEVAGTGVTCGNASSVQKVNTELQSLGRGSNALTLQK